MNEPLSTEAATPHYVGFWIRFLAFCIDSLWAGLLLAPLAAWLWPGADPDPQLPQDPALLMSFLLDQAPSSITQLLLTAAAIVAFWLYTAATPGKMVFKAVIVNADDGGTPSNTRYLIRYLGYFVNIFALGLGFLWIAWDPRKQGWHDKLAGTVVVRRPDAR